MRERAHGGCRKSSIFDPLAPADKPGRIGPLEVSVVVLRVCSPLPIATLEEPLRRRRHRRVQNWKMREPPALPRKQTAPMPPMRTRTDGAKKEPRQTVWTDGAKKEPRQIVCSAGVLLLLGLGCLYVAFVLGWHSWRITNLDAAAAGEEQYLSAPRPSWPQPAQYGPTLAGSAADIERPDIVLERLAFGSCNKAWAPQRIWGAVRKKAPQV